MQTALDWLIEQMPYEFRANHTQELFRQAKEKEKEQIIDAAYEFMGTNFDSNRGRAKEYYNEKYLK
jgi:hypothetical protein